MGDRGVPWMRESTNQPLHLAAFVVQPLARLRYIIKVYMHLVSSILSLLGRNVVAVLRFFLHRMVIRCVCKYDARENPSSPPPWYVKLYNLSSGTMTMTPFT